MRTRNAETPKSGATKKTPPKKDASAAADKTPDTKSTPKSASGVKTAKRQSTPKAAPVAATPDPKLETKVEEMSTPSDVKPGSAAKSPVKKPSGKTKSPQGGKAVEAPMPEEEPTMKVELKAEDTSKEDVKDDPENSSVKMEEDSAEKDKVPEGGDHKVDEDEEQEGFQEPGDEEFVDEEEEGGEGEEGEEAEEEEGGGVEEEEQNEISDMARRRKIKKEQEIFVGGLDRDAVEEDVKKAFEKIGEVVEVRLHRDFATNKNKGFAFVKFADKEQAARALSELKNPVIRGKRCGIASSEDNDTLFLGNICNTWTKEAIKRKLKEYGVDGVENITLVADTQNEGLSRGFAFLEFSCHADAMLAYKHLQKPDVIFGHPERTAKVAFAEPLREPDAEVMAQVKSVFVDGLPPYWDEDRVKEQFKGYGEIERVVLARNMPTAKRKDFGFVNFTTHEAAVACVEGVNNTELGDGKSKMKARARLANPLPKTQAVKGGMRGGFRIGHSGIGGFSRFGRGFGRGRYPSHRAGFQGGRGFYPRGRGRSGRFPFASDNLEVSHFEFRGRRPFGVRGGRRGRGTFEASGDEFAQRAPARHGAFDRGRGKAFPSRRQPFVPEGDYGRPFGSRHFGEDPYFYGDGGHGLKRPYSMMDHDSGYLEPGSRLRARYDHPDSISGGSRYRDSSGIAGGLYSDDYYGSDYGASTYSSMYGGEHSGGSYYY